MKAVIRKLAPPVLFDLYRKIGRRVWMGRYETWDEAREQAGTYAEREILERVKSATLKVINKDAAFERDSVVFYEKQYNWPLLASLLWVAAREGGVLNIIDFGGALGSTYFQNRGMLESLRIRWNVVEQAHFVQCGRDCVKEENVSFFNDVESCLEETRPSAILFSSVLQYLEQPFSLLEKVVRYGFEYILIDRTPFTSKGGERITVQRVPSRIYSSSYACRFFDEEKLVSFLCKEYRLVEQFESFEKSNIPSVFKGFLFLKSGAQGRH